MSLISLFFIFMYIGACTIGGGLVAITLMQQELLARGVITADKFYAMVAISESTPGPIGINMATYIGYELYGILGSIVLTAGIVLPSLITILIIAKLASAFQKNKQVQKLFYGLRAAAVGMIAVAVWHVITISIISLQNFKAAENIFSIFNIKQLIFFCAAFFINAYVKKMHPIFFVLLGAIFGILFL